MSSEPEPVEFSFSEALARLKAGEAVTRRGWNGRGMFIVLMPELRLPPFNTQGTERRVNDRTAKWIGEDQPLNCRPYFAMYTAQKEWQPGWLASQADMLADDWHVFTASPAAADPVEPAPAPELPPAEAVSASFDAAWSLLHRLGGTNPDQPRTNPRFGSRHLAQAHTHAEASRMYLEEHLKAPPAPAA